MTVHTNPLTDHRHAISLYFTFYNWTRIHKTLRTTPAMAALAVPLMSKFILRQGGTLQKRMR